LCRAEDDADLPSVYHEWAARPRGVSERWVLQQAVDAACATLGAPGFEVTPTQVMAFKNFRFAGASYTDIGAGLLPFSITPADAIAPQARSMLAVDLVRADAFDLGGDPESGVIAPGEVSRLRNLSGYVPISWMEARWAHPTQRSVHTVGSSASMTDSSLAWKERLTRFMAGAWGRPW
jgi:hypothetical protein